MSYPKIGIRPTIDGRQGGIREGLEAQTMSMARAAKELIEKNLRYPDSTPVQCIISDTTIGGGALCRAYNACLHARIPVSMHNVVKENIFRPHSFYAFGTDNAQAADYAACKAYGPLYK